MLPTQLIETQSMTEAIENTFDGRHPCELCEVAKQMREAGGDPAQPEGLWSEARHNLLPIEAEARLSLRRPGSAFKAVSGEIEDYFENVVMDTASPPPRLA